MSQSTLDARFALHFASQLPAAFAACRLEPRDDFSHTALTVAGDVIWTARDADGTRVGLHLTAFALRIEVSGDARTLHLDGLTLAAACDALSDIIGAPLTLLGHDLPDHPLRDGAAFAPPTAAGLQHWAYWFGAAQRALAPIAQRADASPVRVWPHHFDTAVLISLDAEGGEDARSVGIGFSPGDGDYPAGYFYVTPWPYPSHREALPALPAGHWHTDGWVGAVLSLNAAPDDATIDGFIAAATDAAFALLPAG